jgi:hypothetical protein
METSGTKNLATQIIEQALVSITQKFDFLMIDEERGTVWYSYYYNGGSFLALFNYNLNDTILTITLRDIKNGTYAEGTTTHDFQIDDPQFEGLTQFLRKRMDSFFLDRRQKHRTIHFQRVRDVGPEIYFQRRK